MRKRLARQISKHDNVYGELKKMMLAAYDAGAANAERSVINPSFTKGAFFNIFWPTIAQKADGELVTGYGSIKGAEHMLREFGQFWDGWVPVMLSKVVVLPTPHHEEPIDPRSDR